MQTLKQVLALPDTNLLELFILGPLILQCPLATWLAHFETTRPLRHKMEKKGKDGYTCHRPRRNFKLDIGPTGVPQLLAVEQGTIKATSGFLRRLEEQLGPSHQGRLRWE